MFHKPITIFLLLVATMCSGQSVRFISNLQSAINMAQSQNKLIFVDTYAQWCIPCKKMEKEFRDPALASYFNNKFVNVRIDMDSEHGKELHRNYDVIFLPTLMILDKNGGLKFSVDRAMTAKSLLDIAQKIAEPEIYAYHPPSFPPPVKKPIVNDPPPTQTLESKIPRKIVEKPDLPVDEVVVNPPSTQSSNSETNRVPTDNIEGTVTTQKIIHVFDPNSDDLPPEILRQEAYLRLQLMDGSHKAASKKYLDTQSDWTSKDNMSFILDFLHSTESREFQHVINNRERYEELFGKDRVYKNISYLVYDRLNRGFPRPTFEETKDLFSYLDPIRFEQYAYEHYMESLYTRGKSKEYGVKAEEYISSVHSKNDQVYYRLALIYAEDKRPGKFLRSMYCIKKAVEINPHNYQYFDTQAYLYYRDGNKRQALKSAKTAKSLATKNGQDIKDIEMLIRMIQEDL